MKLSDIVSHANLAFYPEVALVLFLFVFALVCLRVFVFSTKREMDAAARIPLGDDDRADRARSAASKGDA